MCVVCAGRQAPGFLLFADQPYSEKTDSDACDLSDGDGLFIEEIPDEQENDRETYVGDDRRRTDLPAGAEHQDIAEFQGNDRKTENESGPVVFEKLRDDIPIRRCGKKHDQSFSRWCRSGCRLRC